MLLLVAALARVPVADVTIVRQAVGSIRNPERGPDDLFCTVMHADEVDCDRTIEAIEKGVLQKLLTLCPTDDGSIARAAGETMQPDWRVEDVKKEETSRVTKVPRAASARTMFGTDRKNQVTFIAAEAFHEARAGMEFRPQGPSGSGYYRKGQYEERDFGGVYELETDQVNGFPLYSYVSDRSGTRYNMYRAKTDGCWKVASSLTQMNNDEGVATCVKSLQSPGNYLPTAVVWADKVVK